ncbi:MAG: Serine/threonine-protein kinase PknD [Acidobacteria bacterium]|nr:Serine/threonine-protein kinase PknD [Acidobacteriota bacterium]
MTPERWKQIDQLLQEALEREPAERVAYLAEACGGDDELRREVVSLLGFHERAENFIETPPTDVAADWLNAKESRAGQTIGHYELIRRIGRGGMGEVYLARDARLGRQIALKLLQSSLTQDAARVRRFRQEARAASSLNHPNILTIYEVGQEDSTTGGAHFIAAEFVDGQTLRELCRGEGLTLGAALDILIQVAGALTAAHEAGIVHRDIKPENIMLRGDGLVKVLDFGLAKLTEQATRPHTQGNGSFARVTTQPGVVMGTINYMSPEQARGLEVDERSDLFSLGVVMYELLTGSAPFEGETTGDVLVALLAGEPRPLARYAAKLPEALQQIINRALAKPVEQRYQTARELGAELKRLKDELEFAAKVKGQSGSKDDILTLTVGVAVDAADHSTFETRLTVEPPAIAAPAGGTRFAALRGWLRLHVKAVAVAALALIIIAAALAWRRFAQPGGVIDSVAVLPFANVDGDPQMEYLSDGVSESLMQRLSQLPGLRVMARGAVFTYKGREVDPRRIGADLNVRAVVTGRVQRQGPHLLVAVEMADTSDGAQLWSESYQRTLADLVTVQEEIAREISVKLRLRLSDEQRRQAAHRATSNSEAYQLYLKGLYLQRQLTRENVKQVLDYHNQAILSDPRFALAYSGIAYVYAQASGQYFPPGEAMPKAKQAALSAIALDDSLPEAHFALGLVKFWGDWDWPGAEQEFKRALTLDPNHAETHIYFVSLMTALKRFDEASREAERLEQLDPVSPYARVAVTNAFYYSRQYDRAYAQILKTLDFQPGGFGGSMAHNALGRVLIQKKQYQEALTEFRQAAAIDREDSNLAWLAYGETMLGRKSEAKKILRELIEKSRSQRVSPSVISRIYLGLGDNEQALEWARKAYEEHSDHVLRLGVDPIYDPLRNDARFIQLIRDIGLTP